MTTIYSKAGTDAAIAAATGALTPEDVGADPVGAAAAAVAALGLGTAATTDATDYATAAQGVKADASDVHQVTLTGPLALTIPAGHPAGQVYRCAITQTTGGHTVTYGGNPVAVDLAAGASTLVEIWPSGDVVYPGVTGGGGLTATPDGSGGLTLAVTPGSSTTLTEDGSGGLTITL